MYRYFPVCAIALCFFLTTMNCQQTPGIREGDTSLEATSRKPAFRFQFKSFKSLPEEDNEDVSVAKKDDRVPNNFWIPAGLEFTCKNRVPGYYSDPSPQSKCQAYHLCMPDGRRFTMLCGVATVFNQRTFVCDHWYNYNCSEAESDYRLNDELWEDVLLPDSHGNSNRVEFDSDESKEK